MPTRAPRRLEHTHAAARAATKRATQLDREAVGALDGAALHALVREVGLEDAGELAACVSAAQLADLLDHDLWRGSDDDTDTDESERSERFDGARFGLWLEVLLESGAAFAAERVLALHELQEDVVPLGFSRVFHVFDTDSLAATVQSDDDEGALVEKLLLSSACTDLDGFFLVATGPHSDAALAVMMALDEQHRDALEHILRRIAALTDLAAEDVGGLFALLRAGDRLEDDAAGARLERREAQGFVSPPDAKAFLALCHKGADVEPIARAYLGPRESRTRADELAFLANALVAHDQLAPAEAARRAIAICGRGMKRMLGAAESTSLLRAFAAGLAQ
ncbi:MAG TPA: DUF6178 family protein [Myxococcota bacterium]